MRRLLAMGLALATAAAIFLTVGASSVAPAADPLPTCAKPTTTNHSTIVDYMQCLQSRTEALHPVPTATETVTETPEPAPTVTETVTETVTASPTPDPEPTTDPTEEPTEEPTTDPEPTGDFPDASNTGVPEGTTLTAYTGPSTITTANTVIDGKTLGCIRIKAPGVTIRNSRISCAGYAVAAFDGDYSGARLLLEDVEIDCKDTNATAIGEALVTVRRAEITGCENGFDINQEITVVDSFIHDLYNGGDAHMDGIQLAWGHYENGVIVDGAKNVTIRHNTIFGMDPAGNFGTSAIITNPAGDVNILIENNLLAGGAATVYCNRPGAGTNYRLIDNHFSTRFSPKVGFYMPSTDCGDETQSGNVYHETGQPITLG